MKPVWDVVDGVLYASISHWGMFPVSSRNLIKLENMFHMK